MARHMEAGARQRGATKGDRRQDALLDALEELVAEKSIASVSIDEISARAGVTRTGFYFYFRSREEALQRLVERSVAPSVAVTQDWLASDDPVTTLQAAMATAIDVWRNHPALLTATVDAAAYNKEIRALWTGVLERIARDIARHIDEDLDGKSGGRPVNSLELAWTLTLMVERTCYQHFGSHGLGGDADPEVVRDSLVAVWRATLYDGPPLDPPVPQP